jgi:glycosyltransferase involved in cell wall biosynthesis
VRLRIGIDARAAAEVPAGRGRVVRELLHALAGRDDPHEYVLYARRPWTEEPLDRRFRWLLSSQADPFWNVRVGLSAHKDSDVFFSVNSYLTAWFTRVPTALNVFDMIAWEAPESAQPRAARIERATIRSALRRAGQVFCNSTSTLADLRKRFPVVEDKASVVPLAADERFRREVPAEEVTAVLERLGLDRPFVLTTGTVEPRKNLSRLIEAFTALPEQLRNSHLLAIVGPPGWEDSAILASSRAQSQHVRLLGRVTDAELAALYASCEVFCYPSLYEGFGLPVLEAMQAGAPVVTSAVSSLPEVGGEAALYIDPTNTEELSGAIARLLSSEADRSELGARGPSQAARFSWDRTADAMLAQLVALAGEPQARR